MFSHTQNINTLIFQTAKCSFTFIQRYSFTPDQFRNIFMRLSFLTGAFHVYILLKEMSRVMRNPAFCICENTDADQLRGNREADQRLCFRYTDSTIPLLPKSEISSIQTYSVLYSLVCVGPGRKPERCFSHDAAQM